MDEKFLTLKGHTEVVLNGVVIRNCESRTIHVMVRYATKSKKKSRVKMM